MMSFARMLAQTRAVPRRGYTRTMVSTLIVGLAYLLAVPTHAAVRGQVRRADNQAPLVGARVSVQASAFETKTDTDGRFELPHDISGEVVIVAASKGYFNASAITADPDAELSFELEVVPNDNNPDARFAEPLTCSNCHFEQYVEWQESPMAMAGDNTWVYDTFDGTGTAGGDGGFVYRRDSVHAEENPASECAACHQPEPWLYAPFTALEPLDQLSDAALHGISCETCHKIANVDETKPNYPGLHPDAVSVTRPHSLDWTVEYGTLGDTDYFQPAQMRSSYQPQLRAAVCGACHQDKNDHDADGDFEDSGGIISEPTYLEWLESAYADPTREPTADCVDCHMPVSGLSSACNKLPLLARPEGDVRIHEIVGTTPQFLDNAVTMTLAHEVAPGEIEITVDLYNHATGHHVPTGVTIRNMILVVEVRHTGDDRPLTPVGDQVVHDLGGTAGSPAQGYYGGLPGKLYAKINRDAAGNSPTFFTDAVEIVSDTRIPALEHDVTTYRFESDTGGEIEVRARLIYRRSWRALVDAKGWTEDGHGNPLEDVTPPHFGHLMEEATVVTMLDPPLDDGDTGDSDTDGGESTDDGDSSNETGTSSSATDTGTSSSATGGSNTGESDTTSSSDNDDDRRSGCGCRVPGGGFLPVGWALLVGGATFRRLRRRGGRS